MFNFINYLKPLFKNTKGSEKPKTIGLTWEAKKMKSILEAVPNVWIPKQVFIDARIYNPGRPKSLLDKLENKLILCKIENRKSYWMYVTNYFEASSKFNEKDYKRFERVEILNRLV